MRTKIQIKTDRFFMVFIGILGVFGLGFYTAQYEIIELLICIAASSALLRIDKLNNNLEYGRYIKEEKSEVEK